MTTPGRLITGAVLPIIKNGNMTKDLNSNISLVEYNFLNLPSKIEFMDGSTTWYTYDATGRKLRAEYHKGGEQDTLRTDYCGNLIYEQGRPHMLLVDGGYVTFNVNDNGNVNDSMQWHYYLKDHLGNNRVVVNTNDSIEQVNHYYPYGGLMAGSIGGDHQRYKYNGKELDRMHGLDWYDYGARWMNGLTFTTPDPKAWDYTDVSPYVYCHNNPISRIDPDGMDDYFDEEGKFIKRTDTGTAVLVMCDNQFKSITDIDFTENKSAIQNIGSHYLSKFDKQEFNLSVSNTGGDVPQNVAFSNNAGTQKYDIYLTDGHVNSTLGNCYDFECVTFHESTHRYDESTHGGTIGEANAIIRTATECPAWNNASENYIQSQASYATQSLNKYGVDNQIPKHIVQQLNSAFLGNATFELNNNKVSVSNLLKDCIIWGNRKK